jgi:hypothetical protein
MGRGVPPQDRVNLVVETLNDLDLPGNESRRPPSSTASHPISMRMGGAESRVHLASQRVTIAKVGGIAAEMTLQRLREWAGARRTANRKEWSNDQWPSSVRVQVDAFADRLRGNSLAPPVVHFVEWSDLWSMGDVYMRWLAPLGGPPPLIILQGSMVLEIVQSALQLRRKLLSIVRSQHDGLIVLHRDHNRAMRFGSVHSRRHRHPANGKCNDRGKD